MRNETAGPLVIIGGAEDKEGKCTVLREFVRLAGGKKARIAIMTVASGFPHQVGSFYEQLFRRLGAADAQALRIRERDQANSPGIIRSVEQASAVFFTGGEQLRITNLLGGTEVDQLLHRRHAQGMVLGGTSAGASMMSATMIVEGRSAATPRLGNVTIGPGLEFLHGVIIDQHFGQRGRSGRLLSALVQYPHQLGIGIDEDTALVMNGELLKVIGCGAVTVLDAGAATYNDVLERKERQHVAICNVRLHVLTAGFSFDLEKRVPLMPQVRPSAKRKGSRRHENRKLKDSARAEYLHSSAGLVGANPTRELDGEK